MQHQTQGLLGKLIKPLIDLAGTAGKDLGGHILPNQSGHNNADMTS